MAFDLQSVPFADGCILGAEGVVVSVLGRFGCIVIRWLWHWAAHIFAVLGKLSH